MIPDRLRWFAPVLPGRVLFFMSHSWRCVVHILRYIFALVRPHVSDCYDRKRPFCHAVGPTLRRTCVECLVNETCSTEEACDATCGKDFMCLPASASFLYVFLGSSFMPQLSIARRSACTATASYICVRSASTTASAALGATARTTTANFRGRALT